MNNPKSIVIVLSGLYGILNTAIAIAKSLRKEGHTVSFISPVDHGEILRQYGFAFYKISKRVKSPADAIAQNPNRVKRILDRYNNIREHQHQAIDALNLQAYEAAFIELQPDVAIIDLELHEHIIMAYAKGIPIMLLSCWFDLWPSDTIPHPGSNIVPNGQNAHDIQREWTKIIRERHIRSIKMSWRSGFTAWKDIILAYANLVGFPLRYFSFDHWPRSLSFKGIPTLVANTQLLEFPAPTKDWLHYIGPQVNTERPLSARDIELIDRLKQIKDSGKKIVYLVGTTMDNEDDDFAISVRQHLHEFSNIYLVATSAIETDIRNSSYYFGPMLPQSAILEAADLCINHAGINTIKECIHHEVPMIIYSGAHNDQNGCAARLAYHNLAIVRRRTKSSLANIISDLSKILNDQVYKQKVSQVNQRINKLNEESKVYRLINQL